MEEAQVAEEERVVEGEDCNSAETAAVLRVAAARGVAKVAAAVAGYEVVYGSVGGGGAYGATAHGLIGGEDDTGDTEVPWVE